MEDKKVNPAELAKQMMDAFGVVPKGLDSMSEPGLPISRGTDMGPGVLASISATIAEDARAASAIHSNPMIVIGVYDKIAPAPTEEDIAKILSSQDFGPK